MTAPTGGRVLVTGGSGFIGSAVVRRCLADGLACTTLSRRPAMESGADVRTGDVTDGSAVRPAMAGAHLVVHAAGVAHRPGPGGQDLFDRTNVDGTRVVAEAAARAGVRRFVLVSSVAVYGTGYETPDEAAAARPETPYAASKLAAERAALEVSERLGLPVTVLRPPTVIGEGDPGAIATLGRLLLARRFVWVGHGENRKTLIDVSDLAEACVNALTRTTVRRAVYNTGGWRVPVRDLVEAFASALEVPVPRFRMPGPLARAASAAVAPLSGVGRLAAARQRLRSWMSDDVYDAAAYEAAFGAAARTPWRDTLGREARWLRARHQGK